jgi:RimJ/RimL family protein N-acetyltransferase
MVATLTFHDDPAEFLAEADGHLAADPVLNTVVATVAERAAREDAAGIEHDLPHRWWVVARDARGAVAGVGMRTAPFAPYPLYLLPMPTDAAAALAHALHRRREHVGGVNGALPAVKVCAGELARLEGEAVAETVHTRLHEVSEVVLPRPARGLLRPARLDEAELAVSWIAAFGRDADEQAGRPPGSLHDVVVTEDQMRRWIEEHLVWFWVDADDRPVHLTAHHEPSFGAARIGPVYTPREHRGRGYAGNAVALVSQRILDLGARPCLFTDQANPTSNQLYAALGYRPVVDMAEYGIGPRPTLGADD